MNRKYLFLLMMLGMIEMNSSIHASGEGMYSEADHSLIGQTREDITGDNEIDEGDVEERDDCEYEEDESDCMSETPMYRQSRNKELSWYQRLFEKTMMRLMGIRV